MKTRILKGSSGFTMIELMIALVISTLVVVGYIGANIYLQQRAEDLHEKTVAAQDANRVIEQMRNAAQAGTFPANTVTAFPNNAPVAGFTNLTNELITVSYANSTANPLDATVTVTWQSYTGRQMTAGLRAYITQR